MSQPTRAPSINKTELPPPARRAAWISLIYLGISSVTLVIYITLILSQKATWQLWSLAGIGVIIAGIAGLSWRLSRRGRHERGIWLLTAVTLVTVLVVSLLIAGVGLIAGSVGTLIVLMMAGQTLPQQKGVNWVFIASIATTIAAGVTDILGGGYQLPLPMLQTSWPYLVVAVILANGFLIVRQFRAYSLSTKLMITFLLTSALAVMAVAFLSGWRSRTALTTETGAGLKSLAESQALVIGNMLDRQVDVLQALALDRNLRGSVDSLNGIYLGLDEAAIKAKLLEIDRDWQAAGNDDPLIRSRTDNLLSRYDLAGFRTSFPDHVEVLITDRYGALIAATKRTPDYYQADEPWWQTAYNNGKGAIHIGPPEYYESFQSPGDIIAVPVYALDSNEVVGILRSTYDIKAISNALSIAEPGQTGKFSLYLPGGLKLESGDSLPTTSNDVPVTILAQALNSTSGYVEFTVSKGAPILISVAPVVDVTNDPLITNLGWNVGVSQNREEALAPARKQEQEIQLLGLVIIAISGVVAAGLAYMLANPILRLTNAAQQIAAGDSSVQAAIDTNDEIGTLATAFNTMTSRLRQTIDTLEEQVVERTRQIETVLKISHHLAGILELDELLRQVVNIIKESFNYYHVHIYLLDEEKGTLYVAEGYGQAGAEMKHKRHSIPLDAAKSLVARAAREGRIITMENVRTDPTWLPNPMLPDTHSEMAVPILLPGEIIGVLDVQSEKVGGLTAQDETTMQALANQVATAVRNAHLFSQTQTALDEAQRLQRLYTGQTWEHLISTHPTTDYEYRRDPLPSLAEVVTLVETGHPSLNLPNPVTALTTPLKLRDEVIGVLGVHAEDPRRTWTEDEIALIEAVSEQMSLAIENARLFEESQRSAWRDQVVSESTAKVWSSSEIEEVLRVAVAQLGSKLGATEVVIRLGTEAELSQEE